MARGRMINQKIAEDIDFNEMSIDAQFLFMRAIPFLDRDGLIWGHPGLLASKIAPLLPQYGAIASSAIAEWIESGFVIKYMDGRTPVLFFKGFNKNQSLTHYERETASTFAPPPGYQRTSKGLKPVANDNNNNPPTPEPEKESKTEARNESNDTPDEVRTSSGLHPDKVPLNGSLKEEKGREDHVREAVAVPIVPPEPEPLPPSFSLPSFEERNQNGRYQNSEYNQVAEYIKRAKVVGLSAESFRLMVDAVLEGLGKKSSANAGNNQVLKEAQAAVDELIHYQSGKFRTVEAIQAVFLSWTANDYRGDSLPTCEQFLSHAGLVDMGKVVCNRKNAEKAQPSAMTPNGNTILSQSSNGIFVQGDITRMYQRSIPTKVG